MAKSSDISVLVIGTSGAVGMATRDAIVGYIGADVITYDRPITGTEAEIAAKKKERKKERKKEMIRPTCMQSWSNPTGSSSMVSRPIGF